MPDDGPVDALRAEARSRTICGTCKSSTFVLWRLAPLDKLTDVEEIRRKEERRGITSFESDRMPEPDAGKRAGVVVRCAFFRMNVPDPFAIIDCEGFKVK